MHQNYATHLLKQGLHDLEETIAIIRDTVEVEDLRKILKMRDQVKSALLLIDHYEKNLFKKPRLGRLKKESIQYLLSKGEDKTQIASTMAVSIYEVNKLVKK